MKKIAVLAIVLFAVAAFAGEKEDLALKIFTLQEEINATQDVFKAKQSEYQKMRESLKKEKGDRGPLAVLVIQRENELIEMGVKIQDKSTELARAREQFKAMVK
jgi:septal ring factor EnvC (AmiA/AmiB activator)